MITQQSIVVPTFWATSYLDSLNLSLSLSLSLLLSNSYRTFLMQLKTVCSLQKVINSQTKFSKDIFAKIWQGRSGNIIKKLCKYISFKKLAPFQCLFSLSTILKFRNGRAELKCCGSWAASAMRSLMSRVALIKLRFTSYHRHHRHLSKQAH